MVPYDAAKCGVKSLILCPTINDPDANPNFKDLILEGYSEYQHFTNESYIYNWVKNVEKIEKTYNNHIKHDWEDMLPIMLN
jgi:hypothetical protein